MRVSWFEDPDNVVYADVDQFADHFGKEVGVSNLREEIERFKSAPVKEGVILKGKKRSSLKLFSPNLLFERSIEMGDSVWVYIGENYPAYCLYWPQ